MKGTRAWALVGSSIVALLAVGVLRWRTATPPIVLRTPTFTGLQHVATDSIDDALAASEGMLASNDPFRLENQPADVRYDPRKEAASNGSTTSAPPPPLFRPVLTLKAIVGGPPWQAIVDGIPGQPQGTVVRAGAKYDHLVARASTRDSVIMQGPDTVWVLGFRKVP